MFACDMWVGCVVLFIWTGPPDTHLLVAWLGWMVWEDLAHTCDDWQGACLQPRLPMVCHSAATSRVSSHGGLRVPKAAKEDRPQCIWTYQASACSSLAVVPLAKASTSSKLRNNVGGDCIGH